MPQQNFPQPKITCLNKIFHEQKLHALTKFPMTKITCPTKLSMTKDLIPNKNSPFHRYILNKKISMTKVTCPTKIFNVQNLMSYTKNIYTNSYPKKFP